MAKITDMFTDEEFQFAVIDGYVRVQRHPTKPFNIACYAEKAQYENKWNAVTENCRGIIYDDELNIVARPWRKFYNLGQVDLPFDMNDSNIEVMDKMDGSLGILYWDGDGWAIATKGSFASDQAKHATDLFRKKYGPYIDGVEAMFRTYLFEIVYPSNRIVLNYGDMDDLVLLGCVDKFNGKYYGPRDAAASLGWTGPVVKTFNYDGIADALEHMNRENAEGYVIRKQNFMVKAKQEDYVEMHRVVTNLSEKRVWEAMAADRLQELIDIVPDEWHVWLSDIVLKIAKDFNHVKDQALLEFGLIKWALPPEFERKDFAKAAARSANAKFLFMLLDGRNIDALVWDAVKPKAS